jgi:hypothetical protein
MDSPASLPSISRSFFATCFGAAMVDLDWETGHQL